MAQVKRAETQPRNKREFVGKAWVNEVTQGEHEGTQYLNLTLDRGVEIVVSEEAGDRLLLWPNKKRPDKQDADFRVSLVHGDKFAEEEEEVEETEEEQEVVTLKQ